MVGTGSSRKSAVNSLLWHIGADIPFVPNKRQGGVVIAAKFAPIFVTTLQDAGALAIECDVAGLTTGDHVVLRSQEGRIETPAGDLLAEFSLRSDNVLDEVRAGGRVRLIIGRTAHGESPAGPRPRTEPAVDVPDAPPPSGPATPWPRRSWAGRAAPTASAPARYCEPVVSTAAARTPPAR